MPPVSLDLKRNIQTYTFKCIVRIPYADVVDLSKVESMCQELLKCYTEWLP